MTFYINLHHGLRSALILISAFLLFFSDNSSASASKKVLATTNTDSDGESTGQQTPSPLRDKIVSDSQKALKLLNKSVCGDDDLASWSAVYLRRLVLPHDVECSKKALKKGITSTDLLLRALCWRHLAVMPEVSLPKWPRVQTDDPVIRVIAKLAYMARGMLPADLDDALTIPSGSPTGKNRKSDVESRTNHLVAVALPFDDAPVSLAVAFVETRAAKSAIGDGKGKRFAAEVLRETLLRSLLKPSLRATRFKTGPIPKHKSPIASMLDTRIASHPIEILRAMALTGSNSLKIDGLRALVTAVDHPTAGDLAASAAALSAKTRRVQIEGARTFLLLVKRGQ